MTSLKKINLRTEITPFSYNFNIDYKSNLIFIGSCFTENIGNILKDAKFNIDINPFGILYNPVSVANSLQFLIEEKTFNEDDIFYFNERWNSYYHHSKFSFTSKDDTLNNINQQIKLSAKNLQNANCIFITFGTSWVYELANTDNVVSNCHKVPAKEFKKRILELNEIIDVYNKLIQKLKAFNKGLKIIFTISPIRHLKDGFSENMLSKSILKLAINKIVNGNDNCYYFPSYEILIDDLRDYRFYEYDLLHPNKIAIDYIFIFLANSFFTEETLSIYKKIKKISQAKLHRPFNENSNEYSKFIKKNINNIEELLKKYNFLNLEEEYRFFKKKSDI